MSRKIVKLFLGRLAGLIAYIISGSLGLSVLQIGWTDYAAHSEDKSFTLEMLLSRLSVGILAAVATGISAEKIVDDNGRSAWFVGAIIACVGSWIHFMTGVWAEYPVWYHFAYVLPVIPVTGLSRCLFKRKKIQ